MFLLLEHYFRLCAVNGTAQEGISFKFDNLTIDNHFENQSYGIALSCLQSPAYLNQIGISNNIITNSYCGWYIGGSFYPPNMANIAYYGNYYDHNLADPNFQSNPMYLTESPFETPEEPAGWPYFLKPSGPAAIAEQTGTLLQAPEQMLTSLFSDPAPRGNYGIGYGVALPETFFSEIPVDNPADFDLSGIVDFEDFATFSADWLTEKGSVENPVHFSDPNGYSIADFDKNGVVDINDLEVFTGDWLCDGTKQIRLRVEETAERLIITCKDPNLIEDSQFAIFLDGEYLATREPENNPTFILDKRNHINGKHYLKAVVLDGEGRAYVTMPAVYTFNSPLSGLTYEKFPDPARPLVIKGAVQTGYTVTISIQDMDEQVRWAENFTEDFVAVVDPNVAFGNEICLDLTFTYVPTLLMPLGRQTLLEGLLDQEALFDRQTLLEPLFEEILKEFASESIGKLPLLMLGGIPQNGVAGLILCMIENGYAQGVNVEDTGTCRYAERIMKSKGIYPIVLKGYGEYNQVTYEIICEAIRKFPKIRYLHINAHGNYLSDKAWWFTGNTPRTRVLFNDGEWVSHNSRRWTNRGRSVPEGYQFLSGSLEKARIFDEFKFDYGQIRILVLESCYGLRNVAAMDDYTWLVDYKEGAYEYERSQNPPLNYHPEYFFTDILCSLRMSNSNQEAIGSASLVVKGPSPHYTAFFNTLYQNLMTRNFYEAYLFHVVPSIVNNEVRYEHRVRGLGLSPLSNIWLSSNSNP